MKILDVLRNINNKLSDKVVSSRVLSYSDQHDYLFSLPEPKNDIERSYYQYLCQVYSSENKVSLFVKNIASALMFPIYFHKKYTVKQNSASIDSPSIYIMVNNKTDMLPDELNDPQKLICVPYGDGFYLDNEDLKYIKAIKRKYPHEYYFVYKVLLKMGLYSSIMKTYSPSEIIVNAETSFTSSILTNYCESKGITHTDVMHGEKVFWIRDSFFRFSKCYVWSDYHEQLFKSMRATKSKYIVSVPPAMRFDSSTNMYDKGKYVDYKFYLGYETKETIERFKKIVSRLEKKGKTYLLRPHPVYTDMSIVYKYFSSKEIEDTKEIGIEESILSARNVVSIFSTVLRQAFNADIRVIVDNYSNVNKYKEMKDLKFWLYETDHILLTDELKSL